MRFKNCLSLLVVFTTCTTSMLAESIDDMVSAAVERDAELAELQLVRQQLDIRYELEDLKPPIALAIGTSTDGVAFQTNGGVGAPVSSATPVPAWQFSLTPFAEVSLAGDHKLHADLNISGNEGNHLTLDSTGIGYTWNPKTGATRDDQIQALTREDARSLADQRIEARVAAVRLLVLQAAQRLLLVETLVADARLAVDSARDALEESVALDSVGPEGAAAEQLRVQLARAERVLANREVEMEEAGRDLSELTGLDTPGAPRMDVPSLPTVDLVIEETARYRAATRAMQITRLAHGVDDRDPVELVLDASYDYAPAVNEAPGSETPALHTLGAGASIGFGDWLLSLRSSARLSEEPAVVPVANTVTLGLSWQSSFGRREALEDRFSVIETARAELVLQQVEEAIRDDLQELVAERRSLLEQVEQNKENQLLAELRLGEAERRFDLGLVGSAVVEERKEALVATEVRRMLLAYDIEMYATRLSAFEQELQ